MKSLFLCSALCFTALHANADVHLHGLFADHMVLQREATAPVWGTAEPGEVVTVTFRDQKAMTTADANGQWKAELSNLAVGPAAVLTVAGKNTVTIDDVQVGDVWLCSGQSNMAFQVKAAENADHEIATAIFPMIRHFRVKSKTAEAPQKNLGGQWQVCSPETVGDFTAVGYFFARDIQTDLGIPIGLIHSSWGGTTITAWMSHEALASDPACAVALDRWAKTLEGFPAAEAKYSADLAAWTSAEAEAKAAGTPFTKKKPLPPEGAGGRNAPSALFNGMIAPVIPFALKGVLWYQGEHDASHYADYRAWFPTMIKQWRHDFGQGDLPFLYVQLPNHNSEGANSLSWAFMRGVQAEALALPNTGMAVTIDVGENGNVHPKKKQPVGYRLASIAQAKVYRKNVLYEGPVFEGASKEGAAMVVHFQRGAEGLMAKDGALREFQLAGADQQFKPAEAKIEGALIRVTSAEVKDPVAVRYAWRNGLEVNLFNREGLPAAPFRSDDWK